LYGVVEKQMNEKFISSLSLESVKIDGYDGAEC
jgi:hypothetical protein